MRVVWLINRALPSFKAWSRCRCIFSEQAAFDLEMRLAVESRNLQNRVVFADRRDVLLYARVDTDGVFGRFPDILGYFLVDKGNDYAAGLQGDPDDLGLLVFR